MVDGREILREVGWVGIEYGGDRVHTLALIGEPGDAAILGAITLEEFALQVDPVRRVLTPVEQLLLVAE